MPFLCVPVGWLLPLCCCWLLLPLMTGCPKRIKVICFTKLKVYSKKLMSAKHRTAKESQTHTVSLLAHAFFIFHLHSLGFFFWLGFFFVHKPARKTGIKDLVRCQKKKTPPALNVLQRYLGKQMCFLMHYFAKSTYYFTTSRIFRVAPGG